MLGAALDADRGSAAPRAAPPACGVAIRGPQPPSRTPADLDCASATSTHSLAPVATEPGVEVDPDAGVLVLVPPIAAREVAVRGDERRRDRGGRCGRDLAQA